MRTTYLTGLDDYLTKLFTDPDSLAEDPRVGTLPFAALTTVMNEANRLVAQTEDQPLHTWIDYVLNAVDAVLEAVRKSKYGLRCLAGVKLEQPFYNTFLRYLRNRAKVHLWEVLGELYLAHHSCYVPDVAERLSISEEQAMNMVMELEKSKWTMKPYWLEGRPLEPAQRAEESRVVLEWMRGVDSDVKHMLKYPGIFTPGKIAGVAHLLPSLTWMPHGLGLKHINWVEKAEYKSIHEFVQSEPVTYIRCSMFAYKIHRELEGMTKPIPRRKLESLVQEFREKALQLGCGVPNVEMFKDRYRRSLFGRMTTLNQAVHELQLMWYEPDLLYVAEPVKRKLI